MSMTLSNNDVDVIEFAADETGVPVDVLRDNLTASGSWGGAINLDGGPLVVWQWAGPGEPTQVWIRDATQTPDEFVELLGQDENLGTSVEHLLGW